MATIFERAFQYAYDKCGCRKCNIKCKMNDLINMDVTCDKHNAYRKLYIKIATEQRKIDIEKAVSYASVFFSRPEMMNFDKALEDFRKSMEEL